MKRREDPGDWIDELEGVSARYTMLGVKVAKEALIAKALVAAHDDVLVAATLAKGDDLPGNAGGYSLLQGDTVRSDAWSGGSAGCRHVHKEPKSASTPVVCVRILQQERSRRKRVLVQPGEQGPGSCDFFAAEGTCKASIGIGSVWRQVGEGAHVEDSC
jgi:hypothetical protein